MLRFSVVCTVESLFLFYLLFESRFICTRRCYIDKLGIFYVTLTSMCLDPRQKQGWNRYRQTCLSPPVFFLPTVPRQCLFGGSFLLFDLVILSCLFVAALWSTAGKGLTSWLSFVWCFLVFCHFPIMVSWVRCGTWLYRFLSFAFFTTSLWYKNTSRRNGGESAGRAVYRITTVPSWHFLHIKATQCFAILNVSFSMYGTRQTTSKLLILVTLWNDVHNNVAYIWHNLAILNEYKTRLFQTRLIKVNNTCTWALLSPFSCFNLYMASSSCSFSTSGHDK